MVSDEIDLVVSQFKSLLRIGHEASLKLDCKLGEVLISLSCKVGRNEPPCASMPTCDVKRRRSPSYFRRQARRGSERESRSVDSTSLVDIPITEEVKEEPYVDETCKNISAAEATAVESDDLVVADKVLDTQMYDSAEGESTPVDNNLKADEPSCNLKSGQLEYRPLFEDGSRAFLASGFNR